jgi:hypothetical protein
MADNLQTIQDMIASEADQTAVKVVGDSDWDLRNTYINWSQRDFGEAYNWRSLTKEVYSIISQATGNATIPLPWDYRKPAGYFSAVWDGSITQEYTLIDITRKSQYSSEEKYVVEVGNPRNGYSFVANPPSFVSGASIHYTYHACLPSLASPADISMCPDAEYLVQRSLFYLYRARSDPRFQEAAARSDLILARLIENEESRGEAFDNTIQVNPRSSLRWGK